MTSEQQTSSLGETYMELVKRLDDGTSTYYTFSAYFNCVWVKIFWQLVFDYMCGVWLQIIRFLWLYLSWEKHMVNKYEVERSKKEVTEPNNRQILL